MLNLEAFAALQKEGTYKTEISDPSPPGPFFWRASADYQDINVPRRSSA
ncbi:MAG: hypothetical protein ACLSHC_15885 [Bilophila wadsworthia]